MEVLSFQEEFQILGVDGRSHPTALYRKFAGRKCLVVATAACVWDDVARLDIDRVTPEGEYNGWDIIAVNDMIMHWPGVVHHGYSNQHRWLPHWCNARRETISGYVVRTKWGEVRDTHSCIVGGKNQWPWPGHGTSTLCAVYTALALGYAPVVICGAPLDNTPHYFEPPWSKCNFEREVGLDTRGQMHYWEHSRNRIFRDRVRAMSGRTRDLLGEYTP